MPNKKHDVKILTWMTEVCRYGVGIISMTKNGGETAPNKILGFNI